MNQVPTSTMLGRIEIEHVLEHFDFPRLFTCRSNIGQRYIAVSVFDDDESEEFHWLYVSVSIARLKTVLAGAMSIYEAFREPESGYLIKLITRAGDSKVEFLLPEQVGDEDLPARTYTVRLEYDIWEESLDLKPARIAEATRRETFNYRIFPDLSRQHEIPSRKLGGILSSTQELIDALGQVSEGEATVRGPLPGELLQRTRVNVTHVFQGSFGVQFRAANNSDLFSDSVVGMALLELMHLLSARDSEDLLSNKLHYLKGRVASKYRRLLKELSDINSGLALEWGSVRAGQGGEITVSREQIARAYAIVDRIDIEMAEEVTLLGRLVGFNSRTKRYEIKSAEDEKTYSGAVADGADIAVLNPAIGENYLVKLRMLVETQSSSGDELVRWIMVSLQSSRA